MPAAATPKNWPPTLPYLTNPAYSTHLTAAHHTILKSAPKDPLLVPANTPKGPSNAVKITPIKEPTHPAYTQSGLFAARDLKPGTFILLYLGEIHGQGAGEGGKVGKEGERGENDDTHAHSDYDLSLCRESGLGLGIDAAARGNEARFVNDYRGVQARPNAEFCEVWDGRRGERGMGVWVLPAGKDGKSKGIRRGEEILVSYGRGFWGARRGEGEGN